MFAGLRAQIHAPALSFDFGFDTMLSRRRNAGEN
jgi:hypothetical protein